MAKVVYKGRTPSWELDEEEIEIGKQAAANSYSQKEASDLIKKTQEIEKNLQNSLSSTSYQDRSTRIKLQKQLYEFQSNLKRLKLAGIDTTEATNKSRALESAVQSKSSYYGSFKNNDDYMTAENGFYGRKYSGSNDADNIKTVSYLRDKYNILTQQGNSDEAKYIMQ